MVSGAAVAFGALLLIVTCFASDLAGFLINFPLTRRLIFKKFLHNKNNTNIKKNYIDGEFEELDDDNERKL